MSDDLDDLIAIVRVVGFVVHDEDVINKVETVRLGVKWIVDHFITCSDKGLKSVSNCTSQHHQ